MSLKSEIEKLYECRLLETQEDCEEFDAALESISATDFNERDIINDLFRIFDDETEDEEVMFGLLHLIEEFEMNVYLLGVANALPYLMDNAKEWAIIINKRILNSDIYRTEYTKVLLEKDEDIKLIVNNILLEIKNDNPDRFEKKSNEILSKLEGN
ncbi:Imm30 family immunity protein [Bacillus sp. Au-Bac7]|uniref:Imm30 family immunity protein n=1 Tax=Bacillus sp. Au-Bac7 TaxID=2906458 RepID=UPI001E475A84|nr:Imm30 family immunity protein [Bacillus sp. Au-Bac7]MCE4049581.1 immunity 30 family protein [Bacillus sp. Au-Bac7]